MQDQPMMRVLQEFRRNMLEQALLDRERGLALRQPGAICNPEDMRVHGHRRFAERRVQHHVRGLATDPRQGFQRCALTWHRAAVLLDKDATGRDHVLRLGIEQPDAADVSLQPRFAERQDRFGRIGHRIQPARRLVSPDLGGLRRQDDGNQQLERGRVDQLRGRMRVKFAQAAEQFMAVGGLHGVILACQVRCDQPVFPRFEQRRGHPMHRSAGRLMALLGA